MAEETNKMPRKYNLLKAIRAEKDYKSNIGRRDKNSRKFIEEEFSVLPDKFIKSGSLIMFDYFEPKTEEELEYYDAKPCTIFFNVVKTKSGETRVLGFNLHYYPPKIRWMIMDKVMDTFKQVYRKSWASPRRRDINGFDYELLVYLLQKAHLEFGVRMYIPNLMDRITPIPPEGWSKAALTEGYFKKRTREAVMNYWKQWKPDASDRKNIKKGARAAKKLKSSQNR